MIDRLAEIKARLAAATPGPWAEQLHPEISPPHKPRVHGHMDTTLVCEVGNAEDWVRAYDEWQANADFIAHAPEDIAWLVAELEQKTVKPTAKFPGLLPWRSGGDITDAS